MCFVKFSLIIKAVIAPETLINFYGAKQHYIPHDCNYHIRRRKNLEFHSVSYYFFMDFG